MTKLRKIIPIVLSSLVLGLLLLVLVYSKIELRELVGLRTVEGKFTGNKFGAKLGESLEIDVDGHKVLVSYRYWPDTLAPPETDSCVKVHARIYRDKNDSYEYEPTGLLFVPCDWSSHLQERVVTGKIYKSWKSGEKEFVEVLATVSPVYGKVDIVEEEYFGDLKPRKGDCVKIWIRDIHNSNGYEHIQVIRNRNLAPCEN